MEIYNQIIFAGKLFLLLLAKMISVMCLSMFVLLWASTSKYPKGMDLQRLLLKVEAF